MCLGMTYTEKNHVLISVSTNVLLHSRQGYIHHVGVAAN